MRKVILMILLAVVSNSAVAEWVEVGVNNDLAMTYYTDPTTIRKAGDRVKMWVMYDHKTVQVTAGDKYMSEQIQDEYDCKEEQSRNLALSEFSGNMGGGVVVYSDSGLGKWRPIAPRSIGEILWKVACGVK